MNTNVNLLLVFLGTFFLAEAALDVGSAQEHEIPSDRKKNHQACSLPYCNWSCPWYFCYWSTTERNHRFTTYSQLRNSYQIQTSGVNSYGPKNIKKGEENWNQNNFQRKSTTERNRRFTTYSHLRNLHQIQTSGVNSYGPKNIKKRRRKPKSEQFPKKEHH